jgi:hypothetical protein
MADCPSSAPHGELLCTRSEHSPAIAHHAAGTAPDGTRWATFWWHPGEVAPNEQPPVRTATSFPRPRSSMDDAAEL